MYKIFKLKNLYNLIMNKINEHSNQKGRKKNLEALRACKNMQKSIKKLFRSP